MAKSLKPKPGTYRDEQSKLDEEAKTSGTVLRSAGNGFDATKVPGYVERVESEQAEIDAIMLKAREECEPLRENIKAIKKEANEEDSIPRKELNTVLAERRLLAKAEACRGKLSEEQQDNYDYMKHSLGMLAELPLGAAALAQVQTGTAATAH